MFFVPPAHKMALHSLDGARHGIAGIRDHRLEFVSAALQRFANNADTRLQSPFG